MKRYFRETLAFTSLVWLYGGTAGILHSVILLLSDTPSVADVSSLIRWSAVVYVSFLVHKYTAPVENTL